MKDSRLGLRCIFEDGKERPENKAYTPEMRIRAAKKTKGSIEAHATGSPHARRIKRTLALNFAGTKQSEHEKAGIYDAEHHRSVVYTDESKAQYEPTRLNVEEEAFHYPGQVQNGEWIRTRAKK